MLGHVVRAARAQWMGVAVALLALFVALGGPALARDTVASAAKLITGKQVKNGSLTEKDLSAATVRKLRGNAGPAGPRGADGAAGIIGPIGATGTAGPVGPTGTSGTDGTDGTDGSDGSDGAIGPTGPGGSPDTPAQVLSKVTQVDGSGSGLDADLLDGIEASALAPLASAVMDGDAAGGDLAGTYPDPTVGDLPAARMHKTTNSQGTTGSQNTVVVFTVEDFDTGGLVTLASSNSLITIQRAGTYVLSGGIEWATDPNGIRMATLKVNTTTVASSSAPAGATVGNLSNVFTIVRLAAGDTISLEALQNSGGGLSISPSQRTYLAAAFMGG